jgi:hypothetical protein
MKSFQDWSAMESEGRAKSKGVQLDSNASKNSNG